MRQSFFGETMGRLMWSICLPSSSRKQTSSATLEMNGGMMNESQLKSYLVRSIRAQGGVANRFEDQIMVGFPDCLFVPEGGPCFFVEVKLIHGAKLICTTMQEVQLSRLHQPRRKGVWFSHGIIVGYHEKKGVLYIGRPGQKLNKCRYVPRPRALDSSDWLITELLLKWDEVRPEDEVREEPADANPVL